MKWNALLLAISALTLSIQATKAQTVLPGHINTNLTLSDPCYVLESCVVVHSGATLTIPAGTVILGDKFTKGSLVVERGARLVANGTPVNPIIFTSVEPAGSRNPGDWGGIIICGKAPHNQCKDTFEVPNPCFSIYAGGTNADDSSGSLQYIQIHYAAMPFHNEEMYSLTLAGVGRKTVINHIQITYAQGDAFRWFGGNVNSKYLISLNNQDDDFDTDFGYTGKNQYGFSLRLDTSLHDPSGSNGFESDNNNDAINNYASCNGGPRTSPIFSNYTVLGPLLCNTAPVNAEFRRGAHVRRNSAMNLYNSIIAGWPLHALFIENDPTIANTASDALNFSCNSFRNNNGSAALLSPMLGNSGTWTTAGGCGYSIANWFTGASGCRESGNNNNAGSYGVCVDLCTAVPDFRQSNTLMGATTDLSDLGFFDNASFRGAFDNADDWTTGWTEWCPQQVVYSCFHAPLRKASVVPLSTPGISDMMNTSDLDLIPNPASGTTTAKFRVSEAGEVYIGILDKVSGRELRALKQQLDAGPQQILINLNGLQNGSYVIKIRSGINVFTGSLIVK